MIGTDDEDVLFGPLNNSNQLDRVMGDALEALRIVAILASLQSPIEPDAEGVIASVVFPGLRLNVPALVAGDLAGVTLPVLPVSAGCL